MPSTPSHAGEVVRILSEGVCTIPEALDFWRRTSPARVALRHGDVTLTFAELAETVETAAAALERCGIRQGHRVVLVGYNSIDWVVSYLGVLRAGGVIVPANNRISAIQMRDQCELLDARFVLHDGDHLELVGLTASPGRNLIDIATLVGLPPDRLSVDRASWPSREHIALVSFTSGTTGQPKGAMLTHEALLRGSAVFAELLGTSADCSTLILVPLFHNTGFVDQLGHMLVAGGCTNLLARYRTAAAVSELRERPVTFITAVPSILRLLMVSEESDHAFSNAQVVLFGGSPMPRSWTDELLRRWPHLRLVHGYGLTEFTSACSFLPSEMIAEKGESVGYPAPGVELRVVNEQGDDCKPHEIGEVQVSGITCMTGYWRQPHLTINKFSGRWLRTGDLGHLDDDGLLWLCGRVDDVINRGGEKVLPSFVESCIAQRPEISDVSVFGVDDPVLQKRVGAAVELRPGATFSEREMRDALAELLADYAIPEFWVISTSFPRTASGKVDRRAIAADFSTAQSMSQEDT